MSPEGPAAPEARAGPEVSVIMAVYNAEAHVGRAIQSVFDSEGVDLELLIVDDGSADDSIRAVREALADRTPEERGRVRLFFHEENRGYGAVTNTGVAASRGEWLFFVDSDDTVDPSMLAKVLAAAGAHSAQLVIPRQGTVVEGAARPGTLRQWSPEGGASSGAEALRRFARGELVASQHTLMARVLWEGFAGPTDNSYSDVLVMTALFGRCKRVAYVDEPLYRYWIRAGSVTGSLRPTIWDLTRLNAPVNRVIDATVDAEEAPGLRRAFRQQVLWQMLHKAAAEPEPGELSREVTRWVRRRIRWRDLARTAARGGLSTASVLAVAKVSPALHRGLYRRYQASRGPR